MARIRRPKLTNNVQADGARMVLSAVDRGLADFTCRVRMSCRREMTFSSGQRRQSQLFIKNAELVAIISDAYTALWVLTMDEILPIACWAAILP